MAIKGSAVAGYSSGAEAEDDFSRVVAAGTTPSGFGTGPIGLWEQSDYFNGDVGYLGEQSTNGSEGVIRLGLNPPAILQYSYISWQARSAYPSMVVAGPRSVGNSDYWLVPPIDLYVDVRYEVLVDGTVWLQALNGMWCEIGLGQQPELYQDMPGYDPVYSPNTIEYSYTKYYALLDMYVRSHVLYSTSLSDYYATLYPEEGFSESPWYYQEATIESAGLFNRTLTAHLRVDDYGMYANLWPTGESEPDGWMVYSYGDTPVTDEATSWDSWPSPGGYYTSSPLLYNVAGFREMNLRNISVYYFSPGWDSAPTSGYRRVWPYSDPANGYSYAVSYSSSVQQLTEVGTPLYSMNIVWPVILGGPQVGPPVCNGAEQRIAAYTFDNGGADPAFVVSPSSVRVQGSVRVNANANPNSDWGDSSGTSIVTIYQYNFGSSIPGDTGGGSSLSPNANPQVTGGTALATLSCPWNTAAAGTNVPFDFTVPLTDGEVFQWGAVITDAWPTAVGWGFLWNGFSFPRGGSIDLSFTNVTYEMTGGELAEAPDPIMNAYVDNFRLVSGEGTPALATGKLG